MSERSDAARASVIADDDAQARLDTFGRRFHAAAVRCFRTDLTTIRLDLGDAGSSCS